MNLNERMAIFQMIYTKRLKPSQIASNLGRKTSSITREIKRSTDDGYYNPLLAEYEHLRQRKNQCPKLKIDSKAWQLIKPKLEIRWSPQQIAKWPEINYPKDKVSDKTIYNYVHFHIRGELKKLALKDLRLKVKKRKSANKDEKRGKLKDITLIDERPAEILCKKIWGKLELY